MPVEEENLIFINKYGIIMLFQDSAVLKELFFLNSIQETKRHKLHLGGDKNHA